MYRCARCKKPIRDDVSLLGLQCTNCGSRVFMKERPATSKKIIAE